MFDRLQGALLREVYCLVRATAWPMWRPGEMADPLDREHPHGPGEDGDPVCSGHVCQGAGDAREVRNPARDESHLETGPRHQRITTESRRSDNTKPLSRRSDRLIVAGER